ncbi:MAG: hypothetical protein IJU54_01105 [Alphaproteobacteria bacterium]|nr:hypothetical protein [Alphaproteobacteria bacterium]
MTKILSRLFLYGILLSSINYELAYSAIEGQVNYVINFENNQANARNEITVNTTYNNDVIVGKCDNDKYIISSAWTNKENIIYKKTQYTKYCALDNSRTNTWGSAVYHYGKLDYDGKTYDIYPIDNVHFKFSGITLNVYNTVTNQWEALNYGFYGVDFWNGTDGDCLKF